MVPSRAFTEARSLTSSAVGTKVQRRFPDSALEDLETRIQGHARALVDFKYEDAVKVINANPDILKMHIETEMLPLYNALKPLGIRDPVKMIKRCPNAFRLRLLARIAQISSSLSPLGFKNPIRIIEHWPAITCLKNPSVLATRAFLLTSGWGFTIEQIESNPLLLGASPQRLEDLLVDFGLFELDPKQIPLKLKKICVKSLKPNRIRLNLRALGFLTVLDRRYACRNSKVIELVFSQRQPCLSSLKLDEDARIVQKTVRQFRGR